MVVALLLGSVCTSSTFTSNATSSRPRYCRGAVLVAHGHVDGARQYHAERPNLQWFRQHVSGGPSGWGSPLPRLWGCPAWPRPWPRDPPRWPPRWYPLLAPPRDFLKFLLKAASCWVSWFIWSKAGASADESRSAFCGCALAVFAFLFVVSVTAATWSVAPEVA